MQIYSLPLSRILKNIHLMTSKDIIPFIYINIHLHNHHHLSYMNFNYFQLNQIIFQNHHFMFLLLMLFFEFLFIIPIQPNMLYNEQYYYDVILSLFKLL